MAQSTLPKKLAAVLSFVLHFACLRIISHPLTGKPQLRGTEQTGQTLVGSMLVTRLRHTLKTMESNKSVTVVSYHKYTTCD